MTRSLYESNYHIATKDINAKDICCKPPYFRYHNQKNCINKTMEQLLRRLQLLMQQPAKGFSRPGQGPAGMGNNPQLPVKTKSRQREGRKLSIEHAHRQNAPP